MAYTNCEYVSTILFVYTMKYIIVYLQHWEWYFANTNK